MTETTTDETTTNDDEQDQAVAPNVIWGSGQEMFYQAGPVDTLGLAVPTSQPAFAAVKALAFRRAIDDLEGNAPKGSGNVVMDRDLNDPDVRAAVLEDLRRPRPARSSRATSTRARTARSPTSRQPRSRHPRSPASRTPPRTSPPPSPAPSPSLARPKPLDLRWRSGHRQRDHGLRPGRTHGRPGTGVRGCPPGRAEPDRGRREGGQEPDHAAEPARLSLPRSHALLTLRTALSMPPACPGDRSNNGS
jgi:hypothetical protein